MQSGDRRAGHPSILTYDRSMLATSRRDPPNLLIADVETRAVLATCLALVSKGLGWVASAESADSNLR